jgi:hypothetical protein
VPPPSGQTVAPAIFGGAPSPEPTRARYPAVRCGRRSWLPITRSASTASSTSVPRAAALIAEML